MYSTAILSILNQSHLLYIQKLIVATRRIKGWRKQAFLLPKLDFAFMLFQIVFVVIANLCFYEQNHLMADKGMLSFLLSFFSYALAKTVLYRCGKSGNLSNPNLWKLFWVKLRLFFIFSLLYVLAQEHQIIICLHN